MSEIVTAPLQAAIAEAEQLIRTAPFIKTEQDLLEGLEYLSGRIRASIQMAFCHELTRPVLINSTHQYARQGLDNPDAVYFSAYLDDQASYRVSGVRGTTADLSFQVMDGTYSADAAPDSVAAFDDRQLKLAADGSFDIYFTPESARPAAAENWFPLRSGSKTLIIREVYSDWVTESRGKLWIERLDQAGEPRLALTEKRLAKQYEIAAKLLTGSIQTWFAFPQFFTYKEPVNTLTSPKTTPGGLASQFSSIGHYQLTPEQALIVTVPAADCAYQAIQIGSDWYLSTDYETHQTSLTGAQSVTDADGMRRYVISEQNPGIANWLETLGHETGMIMLRWQRLSRDLIAADGPQVKLVDFADLATELPNFETNQIDAETRRQRIYDRQRGVAMRMLS